MWYYNQSMKHIALVTLFGGSCLALSACSSIPPAFDNVGYNNAVVMKFQSKTLVEECNASNATALRALAWVNKTYITNTNEHDKLKTSVNTIYQHVDKLINNMNGDSESSVFCVESAKLIDREITAVVKAMGDRRR